MSWKGFTKAVSRAPQQFKGKFNIGDSTKDPVYLDAERRFKELEQECKKLHEDSKKYTSSINGMLNHQIEFSKAIKEIYKPISGRLSDPNSIKDEGNAAGIQACEEYEAIVRELQTTLAPELEMIESRIVKPAEELLQIIKLVRKMAMKRDHKQLDYDRHRASVKKIEDKKEKSMKDERALYKAQNDLEQSTQEFEYFNEMLKAELPELFALEVEFIKPLFQSFYYMQLNIFYTLSERMRNVDIGYFDLGADIEEAYHAKRGDVQDHAEALSICKFKTTGRPTTVGKFGPGKFDKSKFMGGKTSPSSLERPSYDALPPYSPPPTQNSYGAYAADAKAGGVGRSNTTTARFSGSNAAAKKKPPPPPPTKPKALSAPTEWCVALYDYVAQAAGDLSFSAGDRIEVLRRTDDVNEWWTGSLGGAEGVFPANYVQLG
ncbi:putative BAR adaptor protein RVS167 [Saitoella complicata NRRL Y-17804]|uniref:putative BAR adaptor protein RVS167 n=1 Tax=Saitoella complicata (strain BCRC 22490 / CBS 7301 / JCM 7358 / NBRC 10748 / NRRL Y-17804) TaxID=698492 RepID=UPI000867654D|nr:putative BAR adaptor protein RVS167 [Saitoella complicata NRRL Y-17804]ODQ52707.1 putative BAR adaptor protein RVS167 [Saitoella complicata NRRL Y-17804]